MIEPIKSNMLRFIKLIKNLNINQALDKFVSVQTVFVDGDSSFNVKEL